MNGAVVWSFWRPFCGRFLFFRIQPSEVSPCVMREKGEGEKWKERSDVTMGSSGLLNCSVSLPFTSLQMAEQFRLFRWGRWLKGVLGGA